MCLKKFKKSIKEKNMINKGDSIVIAISGGPDSLVMTHLLLRIKDEYNLKLYGVHLDHLTRDGKSSEDAKFVESFLAKNNIKSYIFTKDISLMAKEMNISFEEAGRLERYKLFNKVKKETNSNKIALGQNLNDQGETLLFRLFRGTGLDGLTGIEYLREDNVIRPILDISRYEIEEYYKKNNLEVRIDHTNSEAIYSRNKIRLKILPYIKEHFNSKIDETLWRTTNILREDKELIDKVVNDFFKENIRVDNNIYTLKIDKINSQLPALKNRVIRKLILDLSNSLEGVTYAHIMEVIDLITKNSTGKYKVINGIKFKVNYDELLIYKENLSNNKMDKKVYIGEVRNKEELNIYFSKTNVYVDSDKINGKIYIRNRKPGDRFTPLGMKGSKKIKDFFIDQKINSELRDKIKLVCDDKNIIWVVGYRLNDKYKITSETKRVIQLKYE